MCCGAITCPRDTELQVLAKAKGNYEQWMAEVNVDIGLGEWPISTYMSLTLARLCAEWQLVSGANYSRYE
jgi:hypothetical protein